MISEPCYVGLYNAELGKVTYLEDPKNFSGFTPLRLKDLWYLMEISISRTSVCWGVYYKTTEGYLRWFNKYNPSVSGEFHGYLDYHARPEDPQLPTHYFYDNRLLHIGYFLLGSSSTIRIDRAPPNKVYADYVGIFEVISYLSPDHFKAYGITKHLDFPEISEDKVFKSYVDAQEYACGATPYSLSPIHLPKRTSNNFTGILSYSTLNELYYNYDIILRYYRVMYIELPSYVQRWDSMETHTEIIGVPGEEYNPPDEYCYYKREIKDFSVKGMEDLRTDNAKKDFEEIYLHDAKKCYRYEGESFSYSTGRKLLPIMRGDTPKPHNHAVQYSPVYQIVELLVKGHYLNDNSYDETKEHTIKDYIIEVAPSLLNKEERDLDSWVPSFLKKHTKDAEIVDLSLYDQTFRIPDYEEGEEYKETEVRISYKEVSYGLIFNPSTFYFAYARTSYGNEEES